MEGFWKHMVQAGCRTERFKDTHDSAWHIIGNLADKTGMQVKPSSEILDCRLRLKQTKGIASLQELDHVFQEDKVVL